MSGQWESYMKEMLFKYIRDKRDAGYDVNDIFFKFCTNEDLIDVLTGERWEVFASMPAMKEWIDDMLKIEFRKSYGKYVYSDCLIFNIIGMYDYCITKRGDNPHVVYFIFPPMIALGTEIECEMWKDDYKRFAHTYYNVNFVFNNDMRNDFTKTEEYKELMKLSEENNWGLDEREMHR